MKKKRQSRSIFLTGFFKLLVLFSAFLFLFSLTDKSKISQKWIPVKNTIEKDAVKTESVEVDIKYVEPNKPAFTWSVEKVDEHITKISIPPDDRMSTGEELNTAMNSYRNAHNLTAVQATEGICSIAQSRANEQSANNGLDSHAGFNKYVQNQSEFTRMGEVLFGGNQPQYGVHIVEFGWDRSLTGHKEAIQDPSWRFGCGAISGYYAVFIFGSK